MSVMISFSLGVRAVDLSHRCASFIRPQNEAGMTTIASDPQSGDCTLRYEKSGQAPKHIGRPNGHAMLDTECFVFDRLSSSPQTLTSCVYASLRKARARAIESGSPGGTS